jgi:hypothetical protein
VILLRSQYWATFHSLIPQTDTRCVGPPTALRHERVVQFRLLTSRKLIRRSWPHAKRC